MKKFSFSFALLWIFLGLNAAQGTTVIPPTFDELVDKAEIIFQGTVTDVRSQWVGEGAQHRIMSYVTFKVEDTMKGAPGDTYTLQMLGGTVDGETMEVSDGPKFEVGGREIVFVENNGSQFIPLVGIMHGRFHVQKDDRTGTDLVTNNEHQAVQDVSKLGRAEIAAVTGQGLSSAEFKSAIRNTLQTQRSLAH